MSISWNALRDYDGSGDRIFDEIISIPVSAPYEVYPEFTPQKNQPTSIELWTGPSGSQGTQYTEKSSINQVIASGDFFVNYKRGGLLTTHEDSASLDLYLTYPEIGTFNRVKYLNSIRNIVGSGDVDDLGGNVNLVSHANDDSIHGGGTPDAHALTHFNGGSDEIALNNLLPSGDVDINGYKITGLDLPVNSGDAVNKSYADNLSATPSPHASSHFNGGSDEIALNELVPSGDLSMASNKITDVTDPTDDQDAATKAYVLANAGGVAKAIPGTVEIGDWIVQPHAVTRILTGEVFEAVSLFIGGVLAIDGTLTITG